MQFLKKLWQMFFQRRRNCLVSGQNYHSKKFFTKYRLATEMKRHNTYE